MFQIQLPWWVMPTTFLIRKLVIFWQESPFKIWLNFDNFQSLNTSFEFLFFILFLMDSPLNAGIQYETNNTNVQLNQPVTLYHYIF